MFGVVYFTPTYFSPAHFGGVVGDGLSAGLIVTGTASATFGAVVDEGGPVYLDAAIAVTAAASASFTATGGTEAPAVAGGGGGRRYATGPAYVPRVPQRQPRYADAALAVVATASADIAPRLSASAGLAVAAGAASTIDARLASVGGMAAPALSCPDIVPAGVARDIEHHSVPGKPADPGLFVHSSNLLGQLRRSICEKAQKDAGAGCQLAQGVIEHLPLEHDL